MTSEIKIKSVADADVLANKIFVQLQEIENLFDHQKNLLTAKLSASRILAERLSISFDSKNKGRISDMDLSVPIQQVGEANRMLEDYQLLDTLTECEQKIDDARAVLTLSFSQDVTTTDVLNKLSDLSVKITGLRNKILVFLQSLYDSSMPAWLKGMMTSISESIVSSVFLTNKQYALNCYLTVCDGKLLYSAFICLKHLVKGVSSQGETLIVPQLYIVVQWLADDAGTLKLSLVYDWQSPNRLYHESKVSASSGEEAQQLVHDLLVRENILMDEKSHDDASSGVVSSTVDALNVEPGKIRIDFIQSISEEMQKKAASNLYLGACRLFGKGVKFESKQNKDSIEFIGDAMPHEFSADDLMFFKAWGLSLEQLQKIQTILAG